MSLSTSLHPSPSMMNLQFFSLHHPQMSSLCTLNGPLPCPGSILLLSKWTGSPSILCRNHRIRHSIHPVLYGNLPPRRKIAIGKSMDFEWCFGDPESSPMSCEPSPVFQMDWEPALPRDTIESNGCFQEFEDNQSFTSEHFSDDPMDFEWSIDVPDPSPMSCEPPPAFQMDWEPSYINNHHNINPTSNLLIQQSSLPSSLPFQPEPMDTT